MKTGKPYDPAFYERLLVNPERRLNCHLVSVKKKQVNSNYEKRTNPFILVRVRYLCITHFNYSLLSYVCLITCRSNTLINSMNIFS